MRGEHRGRVVVYPDQVVVADDELDVDEERPAPVDEASLTAEQREARQTSRQLLLEVAGYQHGLRPEAIKCAAAVFDWSELDVDDDDALREISLRMQELKREHDYLFSSERVAPPGPSLFGDADGGKRSAGPIGERFDPDEISAASARGRLEWATDAGEPVPSHVRGFLERGGTLAELRRMGY